MLFSHTSPSLIENILLPPCWSPRTTFGTAFRKRLTSVADQWKLAFGDYGRTRSRFLKSERTLPGLRTLKESANRPRIERNAALPEFCRDRRPRRPFFSQPFNLVKIRPEQALERLRMGRWLHGKRIMPTRTRRRNGHREEETERSHAKRAIRSVQRRRSSR
jgi:hypothetical protein